MTIVKQVVEVGGDKLRQLVVGAVDDVGATLNATLDAMALGTSEAPAVTATPRQGGRCECSSEGAGEEHHERHCERARSGT